MNVKKEEQETRERRSSNSMVPPGFRFHPTDEELINFYLKKKLSTSTFELDHIIPEVDLNKLEPWDLREKCNVDASHQTEWYFFSHKDKKYPTGTRTNRATKAGFWKATGRDKAVLSSSSSLTGAHDRHPPGQRIGMRKTLVFYQGRAPHGRKTDWIMHEYRLQDAATNDSHPASFTSASKLVPTNEDGWVVCRVFKKKSYEEKSSTSVSSYYDHTNLSDEEQAHTKSSHIVAKLPDVAGYPSQSTVMPFSKSGQNFLKKQVQDNSSLATFMKLGPVNRSSLFSCKQEVMGDQFYVGPSTTMSYQPMAATCFQLPQLESSEMISPLNSFYSSVSNGATHPSIHIAPPSDEKRVADGRLNSHHISCYIHGDLEEKNSTSGASSGNTTAKDFFVNEEELAPHNCIDNSISTQQYWSLNDCARLQGSDQAYVATHLANDQLNFPHFNGALHLGKVQPSMETYPSSYEIELWNFPR